MRLAIMGFAGATANAYGTADTVQQFPLGTRAFGIQTDQSTTASVLNCAGEFVYTQVGGALACGSLVSFISNTWTIAQTPNTANLGYAVGIAANRFTATGQFGWMQISGVGPVLTNATFTGAAAAVYIQAAGTLTTTLAAGKQVCGAGVLVATAATFTRTVKTINGSSVIQVTNGDLSGVFAGLALSGTGVGAGVVNDVDVGAGTITNSVASTASGSVTLTLTYTSLGGLVFNHPFAQGNIT